MWSTWSIVPEKNILKLVILGHLLPFYPHQNPKIKILKNLLEISYYTYIPKIIWSVVPEIPSETGRIYCHSGPYFALLPPYELKKSKFWKSKQHTWRYYHFTNAYHKWQSHDVWFLRYEMQQTEFLIILHHFLPFYPPNKPKNQNFKIKKKPGDIIILHMCTTNDNHMMYSSWDMNQDGQNFLSFQTVFSLFHTCVP